MGAEEGDRQVRALDMCVVAQAWQRHRGDAEPGKLLVGVHGVVLAAGQRHRGLALGQQLRHVGRPDGEHGGIHGQPPPPVLLLQAGLHGWSGGGEQASQAGDAQVAGGSLVAGGEPGR